MLTKTIIIFSSFEGQAKKICGHIKDVLAQNHHMVKLINIHDFNSTLRDYDKVIIASSIRYGKHHDLIENLIKHNAELLNSKKTAFISVNLVARKAEKNRADTNPYVTKFLKRITWKPTLVGVFAGRLDYKRYGYMDRLLIKLIMLITKGPTDSNTDIEYTDWEEVNKFAKELAQL